MGFATPERPQEWQKAISLFMRRHVEAAGARGVVLGLSGGLDSAVVAALAVEAFGAANVHVMWLPSASSSRRDEKEAENVARHLGLPLSRVDMAPLVAAWEAGPGKGADVMVRGNATARLRMIALYTHAQHEGLLVCGTGNKSELLTGYFTKHGDGGVDLLPIGDLYKTEVRELARFLGLPSSVIEKPPSAGLWEGQTDEADLGLPYDELDLVLKGIELVSPAKDIAARTGLPLTKVEDVVRRVQRSEHKRHTPLIPKLGPRTIGIDWRRSVHFGS